MNRRFSTPVDIPRLVQLLSYDHVSGLLRWSTPTHHRIRVGDVAGSMAGTHDGYIHVTIDRKQYKGHVLAWAIMTGEWPTHQIDHINLRKSDNSWANLRLATSAQNRANSRKSKNNKSGFKGVIRFQGKFRAQITIKRKTVWLGDVDCPAAAHFMYIIAADKQFGEFARS